MTRVDADKCLRCKTDVGIFVWVPEEAHVVCQDCLQETEGTF